MHMVSASPRRVPFLGVLERIRQQVEDDLLPQEDVDEDHLAVLIFAVDIERWIEKVNRNVARRNMHFDALNPARSIPERNSEAISAVTAPNLTGR